MLQIPSLYVTEYMMEFVIGSYLSDGDNFPFSTVWPLQDYSVTSGNFFGERFHP